MKKLLLILFSMIFLLSPARTSPISSAQDSPAAGGEAQLTDFIPGGSWRGGEGAQETSVTTSRTFFVHVGKVPENVSSISYGGALNFKYFAGIAYDYLQENMPGETVSFSVNIPRSAVSTFSPIPNRLRVTLKSSKDGVWAEYYEGSEWTNVRKEGKYGFKIHIPEKPVTAAAGETFYPENTILAAVEYYLMEGPKRTSSLIFSISDFGVEGIALDPDSLEWQFMTDGSASRDLFLPSFPEGSTLIYALGNAFNMAYTLPAPPGAAAHAFSGELRDIFLILPVYIPEELRRQKGTVELTIKDAAGTIRSAVKNFDSCNIEGRVYLTIPLDAFSVKNNIEELLASAGITLKIKTLKPHTKDMMPVILEPLKIRGGELIPFDKKWRVRDAQGLGAYKKMDVRQDRILGDGGFSVTGMDRDNYQLTATTRLKGGIDWKNPYYKVEIVRDFDGGPLDLDNTHLEVMISPLTDTQEYWQKPFRARLGLIDMNGNIIFGPNISLSEGLSSVASLDVSLTNPIPKGLVSALFDPKKVRSAVINLEASQDVTDPKDITVSFINFSMRPLETARPGAIKAIDFDRLKRDPGSWELTGLIKETGGYAVGMNYPFPVIKIDPNVLKVPQIYPPVGMKVTDPRHFGFASDITKPTTISDFETFVSSDITLVRFFLLGHLEGVFTWDERGRDIKGFGRGIEAQVQEAAGMSVEKFAEFLNANESTFFVRDDSGDILGLEKHVMGDLYAMLDILEAVEKRTGKRLMAIVSLYDFLLGDGVEKEGPLRTYTVGEHPEVVLDPLIKVKAQALVWKMLKDLSKDPRFHRYISIVEAINEPANATMLATKKNFNDLVNFIGETLYLTKDAIGPKIPVSVGFRSWPADLRFWAPIAGGIDVLMIHYWESLESYNIDTPGMWPLGLPVAKLWKYLGAEPNGRMTGMGEISPSGKLKQNLFTLENAGYSFALLWSYSGHDGHNAKPVMNKIKEYQEGSLLLKKISGVPQDDLKKAFRYLITVRSFFDSTQEGTGTSKSAAAEKETAFIAYLSGRLQKISDPGMKRTIEDIIKAAGLKGVPLDRKNIRSLLFRILANR